MRSVINKVREMFTSPDAKLQEEVNELKVKLQEKQEVINKTNAYWKKKVYELSKRSKGKN